MKPLNPACESESGDASTAELSDRSDISPGSPDDSDNDSHQQEVDLKPPPGLTLPPGFTAPPGLSLEASIPAQSTKLTRLNSQAPLFVPGSSTVQQPKPERRTISLLEGVVEAQQPIEGGGVHALQEAISKLTPQDAAALRSFLNTREGELSRQDTAMQFQQFAAMHGQFQDANYASLIGGMQYQNGFEVAAVPMMTPPGSFCYNQAAAPWMQAPKAAPGSSTPLTADDFKETLRTNLRDLSLADPTCVLMVRKINRLGLESPSILEKHFSKFGDVERAMVSHSRAKSMFGRGAARVRPAGLGFLIMTKAEDVEAVLALGSEQEIQGHTITVHRFESRSLDGTEEAEIPKAE